MSTLKEKTETKKTERHKKYQNKTKRTHKCWLTTPGYGTWPEMKCGWYNLCNFTGKIKTYFPFPNTNSFWLEMELCIYPLSSCWDFVWLEFLPSQSLNSYVYQPHIVWKTLSPCKHLWWASGGGRNWYKEFTAVMLGCCSSRGAEFWSNHASPVAHNSLRL